MHEQDYEQLMLSLEDFPVSPSVWLESKKGKTTTVTSGLRCSELSENLRRVALSVRTYLESSELPPGKWSRIWSKRAITLSCSILKLRLSALSTEENVSPLWATPNTMDYLPQRSDESLIRQAETTRKGRSRPANLREQVDPRTQQLWPTPTTRDYKGANSMESIQRSLDAGKNGFMGQLPNAVKMWCTPTARDYKNATAKEWDNHKNTRNLNRQMAKLYEGGQSTEERNGQLNPTWVEWLMGFPIGWTDLSASETPSCHSSSTQYS